MSEAVAMESHGSQGRINQTTDGPRKVCKRVLVGAREDDVLVFAEAHASGKLRRDIRSSAVPKLRPVA